MISAHLYFIIKLHKILPKAPGDQFYISADVDTFFISEIYTIRGVISVTNT